MKSVAVVGISLLFLALNVQAVSPDTGVASRRTQPVQNQGNDVFKIKPVAPVWQTVAGKGAPKQLASNAKVQAGKLPSGPALRPNCPDYDNEADCLATRWCIWNYDVNGGHCSSY